MPKIITDLEQTLRKEARQMILENGYEAFNMRAVAARCGVAVGTVYNYFSSKEVLAASVMLDDWKSALVCMEAGAGNAPDALCGLKHIFLGIVDFWQIYEGVWRGYAGAGRPVPMRSEYHKVLVGQICAIIAPMLERFGGIYTPVLPVFLAENLLGAAAYGKDRFDEIEPVLRRLV